MVEKIRERILTEETIVELVTLVAEEIDAMAGELAGRLDVIDAELGDVQSRLQRLYEALETSELTLEVLSPRIFSLRHREEQLEAAREDTATQLEQRRVELPTTEEIKGYVADFRDFLKEGTFPEHKALIRNFVEGIEVTGDEAVLTYTIPIPQSTPKTALLLGSGIECGRRPQHRPFQLSIWRRLLDTVSAMTPSRRRGCLGRDLPNGYLYEVGPGPCGRVVGLLLPLHILDPHSTIVQFASRRDRMDLSRKRRHHINGENTPANEPEVTETTEGILD